MPDLLPSLLQQRDAILRQILSLGDFRSGSKRLGLRGGAIGVNLQNESSGCAGAAGVGFEDARRDPRNSHGAGRHGGALAVDGNIGLSLRRCGGDYKADLIGRHGDDLSRSIHASAIANGDGEAVPVIPAENPVAIMPGESAASRWYVAAETTASGACGNAARETRKKSIRGIESIMGIN